MSDARVLVGHRCDFEPPTRRSTACKVCRMRGMAHAVVSEHRAAPVKTVLAWLLAGNSVRLRWSLDTPRLVVSQAPFTLGAGCSIAVGQ